MVELLFLLTFYPLLCYNIHASFSYFPALKEQVLFFSFKREKDIFFYWSRSSKVHTYYYTTQSLSRERGKISILRCPGKGLLH